LKVVSGGEGGRGNVRFASATVKVPRIAEEGAIGEEAQVFLELRLLVEAVLIGPPNTGKSLLMQRIATAAPAVSDYPFTTMQPVLGSVQQGWRAITLAELPGLTLGASLGKGLGNSFLRHASRARLLIYLLDGAVENPVGALREVIAEVGHYEAALLEKPQLVVVNKVDLPHVRMQLPALRKCLAAYGLERIFISALTGEGLEQLVTHVHELMEGLPTAPPARPPEPGSIQPTPRQNRLEVSREGAVFVVSSPRAERLVHLPDLREFQVRLQLRRELTKLGVVKALDETGVQPGDWVRIGRAEFQWE